MTPSMIEAAMTLADTLAEENAALRALDVARAAALLDRKRAAAAGLAMARATMKPLTREQHALALQVAARLSEAAAENKRLLERAIAVQGRVMALLAGAMRPATAQPYGRAGTRVDQRPAPITLSARA